LQSFVDAVGWEKVINKRSTTYRNLSDDEKHNITLELTVKNQFQIRSIPTLMIFREQITIFSQPGAMSGADLEAVIKKAQKLDMDKVREEVAKEQKNT
jgi:thioredoxin 1